MPVVISAGQWDFDPRTLNTGSEPNHGQDLTADAILASMDEIENREEMRILDQMLRDSPFRGHGHGYVR